MVELQEDTGVETDRNKNSFSNGIQNNNIMVNRSESEVDVDFQRVQSEHEMHKQEEDDSIELGVISSAGKREDKII